jgi:hypothetical protein
VIRTYKLALAGKVDYSNHVSNDDSEVLESLFETADAVNAILEPDLSIRLQPLDDEQLVFRTAQPVTGCGTNPLPDDLCLQAPFVPCHPVLLKVACVLKKLRDLGQIDDFDVGHLLGHTDPCSSAGFIGGACEGGAPNAPICAFEKGQGYSGSGIIQVGGADVPNVGLIAHEIGHQLGAYHTFSSGTCGNVSSSSAYEPGSGSTLMSYAGQCGSDENVQNGRDFYYHINSIEWMRDALSDNDDECVYPACPPGNYCASPPGGQITCLAADTGLTSCRDSAGVVRHCPEGETIYDNSASCSCTPGDSFYCAAANTQPPPPNHAPLVFPGGEFSLPPLTAFSLTGSAGDADGHPLTYTWEQYDHDCRSSQALVDDPGPDPLFGSRLPQSAVGGVCARQFLGTGTPGNILPGHPTADENGEDLPGEESISMRLVVRDGLGGLTAAQTEIDVVGTPFAVDVEPAPEGERARVSWNYVNGDATATLQLVQGGQHYDLGSVPSTGEAYVELPPGCGIQNKTMIVTVTQYDSVQGMTSLTFSGSTTFDTYCACPDLLDCGECNVSAECTTVSDTGSSFCWLGEELAHCPTSTFVVASCPCTYPGLPAPLCVGQSQGLFCDCSGIGNSCDDGRFCNGEEICDVTRGCVTVPGTACESTCDEEADLCLP